MWEPGTLVECVDDAGLRWACSVHHEAHPTKGVVYTVRDWQDHRFVRLAEIVNPVIAYRDGTEECAFRASRFRPITDSRLSIFRSLLTETPKTVNVGEEA